LFSSVEKTPKLITSRPAVFSFSFFFSRNTMLGNYKRSGTEITKYLDSK
jgi:hypothetical protein